MFASRAQSGAPVQGHERTVRPGGCTYIQVLRQYAEAAAIR